MRQYKGMVVLLGLAMLLSSCATTGAKTGAKTAAIEPTIQLAQLGGNEFQMQYAGPLVVSYQVRITNPSDTPITLRSLDLQTVGESPYTIRKEPLYYKQEIPAKSSTDLTISVSAYSAGGRFAPSEPVMLRGIAHFDGPDGSFQTVFTQRIRQPQA